MVSFKVFDSSPAYSRIDYPYTQRRQLWPLPKPNKIVLVLVVIFTSAIIFRDTLQEAAAHSKEMLKHLNENPVMNSTLGFQEIFVLALPERHDRKTEIQRGAKATNISLTMVDAVRDNQVSEYETPKGWGTDPEKGQKVAGELGCFISHARLWRSMIAKNISSALFLESDADWDMRVRESMLGLGTAATALIDYPFHGASVVNRTHSRDTKMRPAKLQNLPGAGPDSPYGPGWDILWIGHCGSEGWHFDRRVFTYEDSSAPSDEKAKTVNGGPDPDWRPPGNGTRTVFQPFYIQCTSGYALSLSGARKFVNYLDKVGTAGDRGDSALDWWLMWGCRDDSDVNCLAVWPPIFTSAKSKSNINHEIDDAHSSSDKDDTEVGRVYPGVGIQTSARVNGWLGTYEDGPEEWYREWDDDDEDEWEEYQPGDEQEEEEEGGDGEHDDDDGDASEDHRQDDDKEEHDGGDGDHEEEHHHDHEDEHEDQDQDQDRDHAHDDHDHDNKS